MDECTVKSTTTADSSKELDDNAPTVIDLKTSSTNVVSDEEYKDVNEVNDSIKELNGLKSHDLGRPCNIADPCSNDKKDSLSKRTDEDGSEDEYYDVTCDGSNVDSELSSHEEEHKSADDEVLNDWENDEAQKHEGILLLIFLRAVVYVLLLSKRICSDVSAAFHRAWGIDVTEIY